MGIIFYLKENKYLINKTNNTMKGSWKTTAAAIIVALTGAALALHFITPQVATAIGVIAVSLGLAVAKDSNVTGGTVKQ